MLADAAPQPDSLLGIGTLVVGCLCVLLIASAVVTVILLVRRNRRRGQP